MNVATILESLTETLRCPVCRCKYSSNSRHEKSPVTFPCGHSLCVSCFEELPEVPFNFRRPSVIVRRCPVGRNGFTVEKLTVNYSLCGVVADVEKAIQMVEEETMKLNVFQKLLEDLGQTLCCPVCLGEYMYWGEAENEIKPAILDCGHSLCVSCLETLPLNGKSFYLLFKMKNCPVCQASVCGSLPKICLTLRDVYEAKEMFIRKMKEAEEEQNSKIICGKSEVDFYNEKQK